MTNAVDMVNTVDMVYTFDMVYTVDIVYPVDCYINVVRTTWEKAVWLYGASEQKVGVNGMDGVEWMGDTP